MTSIHIRITEQSIANFDSNPIGYQTKQTVEEQKTARSLLDSRVKDSTNSSLYGKTGSDGAHQHTFLRSNIENSTFHHPPGADGPPFSPERETFCMLSIRTTFCFLILYKNTFHFTPAICKNCTALNRGLADSKQTLRLLSFLSREENVLHASVNYLFHS